MAVQQLQIPSSSINNLVDPSTWTGLGNLGNVYQQAQQQARQQSTLASLGANPAANIQALIQSGDPKLALTGLDMQSQQQQQAERLREYNEQQAIRAAQERRAQATYEEDTPSGRMAKLKEAGIDPKDPAYRPYIVTGQNLPTGTADFTVEKVTNPDGTTSLVRVRKSGPEGPIDVGGTSGRPAVDPAITGEDFLSQLDPARANAVKAIAEGRQPPPSGYALRSPQVISLLRDVAQYEPGFDLTLWKARNAMLTSATSGKVGQNVASFNTAIGHLDALDKSIPGLENTAYPSINAAANAARAQYDPAFAGRLKQFEAAKTAVVDELTRAFRGTGGNVHDLQEWEKTLNSADSPQALHAATRQVVELLRSRIDALGDQYNRGMQTKVPKDALDLLSPRAKTVIQRLSGEGDGGPAPPISAPAPAASAAIASRPAPASMPAPAPAPAIAPPISGPNVTPAAAPQSVRTITRTGTVNSGPNKGKTAVQYSDGTIEYR